MSAIVAVLPVQGAEAELAVLHQLEKNHLIGQVAVAGPDGLQVAAKTERLSPSTLRSAGAVVEALRWFEKTGASHLLWLLSSRAEIDNGCVRRLHKVAVDTRAAITYSDYFDRQADGGVTLHPLIDHQLGSVRDDFDFGQAVLLSRQAISGLAGAIESEGVSGEFGGWYDLRLRASERGPVVHLSEPTYIVLPPVERLGDTHFSYVDPRNRNYQIEMERVATDHLKRIGAWLAPPTGKPRADGAQFAVEASVVIPVRNRVKTVADAVGSALAQEADFSFNVIVVDNHSTDGTSDVLKELATRESRLVHLVPARNDLGIGGCWNEAVYSEKCGRYAVQLDSDDLYSSADVLQRVINEFRTGGYAMVIGSYTIVDFNLKQIPPGLIDHREWTPENGHNNAIRIHGLGAPRAFHVPTLRTLGLPNVSYGEDYAIALRLSREFPIGRIYDSLYWCRRWEGNSDHALPLETQNRYAFYKDRLRSIEVAARKG
ncbi:MAG: glycosyltransferase family 2 protein [Pirellulales bacterium]